MTARAYLSLGSNLGDRSCSLGEARTRLIERDGIRFVSCSAVVETEPVDVLDQPEFLNQVVGLDTELSARDLLAACLEIERGLGRVREGVPPRGPRTIDLDLLLYEGHRIEEDGLRVPHPRLARRPFLIELCRAAGAPEAWIPEQIP